LLSVLLPPCVPFCPFLSCRTKYFFLYFLIYGWFPLLGSLLWDHRGCRMAREPSMLSGQGIVPISQWLRRRRLKNFFFGRGQVK
jgi:hypothetical protein